MVEIERRRRESRNGDGEDRELRISKCTVRQWGGGFEVKTGNSSARRATKENGETIFSGGTSAIVARWLHNATLLVASFVWTVLVAARCGEIGRIILYVNRGEIFCSFFPSCFFSLFLFRPSRVSFFLPLVFLNPSSLQVDAIVVDEIWRFLENFLENCLPSKRYIFPGFISLADSWIVKWSNKIIDTEFERTCLHINSLTLSSFVACLYNCPLFHCRWFGALEMGEGRGIYIYVYTGGSQNVGTSVNWKFLKQFKQHFPLQKLSLQLC